MDEAGVEMPVWNNAANDDVGPFDGSGKPHGQGVLTFPAEPAEDGEELEPEQYIGDMYEGVRVGKGMYRWADGSTYEGDYVNGIRSGHGTLKTACGISYEGAFHNGMLHGAGTAKYKNGDMYRGQFQNGKRHGVGQYHFAVTKCQFVGTFHAGAFVEGRWIHHDGSYCEGNFATTDAGTARLPEKGARVMKFARPNLVQTVTATGQVQVSGIATS